MVVMSNYTETLNSAIDRLQDALDDARAMPPWAISLIVLVSLLTAIVLLHVMAFLFFSPCLYGLYRRQMGRQARSTDALLEEQEMVEENEILEPPSDNVEPSSGKRK